MNAIEKLYDELGVCGCDPDECLGCSFPRKVREGLQAVEREYMERPLDADGVPVDIGDVLTRPRTNGKAYEVDELRYDGGTWWFESGEGCFACDSASHVKTDPLKELLRTFYLNARDVCDTNTGDLDEECAKYAERIRDMLGGAE